MSWETVYDGYAKLASAEKAVAAVEALLKELSVLGARSDGLSHIKDILAEYKHQLDYSKFTVGDVVTFKKKREFGPDHGWRGYAHMFVPGRPAEVVAITIRGGNSFVTIRFQKETYICPVGPDKGKELLSSGTGGLFSNIPEDELFLL
jgi:hypothetical protein